MAWAQVTISGKVVSHADKKPIPNASIFLSNTTVGNETNNNGTFTLKNVRNGKFDIIVSVIGFETYSQPVIINNNNITIDDIEMVPKVKALKEVNITAKIDPDRDKYYIWFKEQFLGNSDPAQDCVIENPDVLDFDYDAKNSVLTASSYDFLKIENKDLGYRLKYLVNNFTYNLRDKENHQLHFEGSVLFEEMKGTPSQERRWQKRRQEAYENSQMHFLRAVLTNRIEEEGFRILQWSIQKNPNRPADSVIDAKIKLFKKLKSSESRYSDSLSVWNKKSGLPKVLNVLMNHPLKQDEILKLTDQKKIYALGCDMDGLHVTYSKDHHFPSKGQTHHLDEPNNKEVTVLNFNSPYAFFDENGGVLNVRSLSLTGAWGRNRVADLLPEDYESLQSIVVVNENASPANTSLSQTVTFDQAFILRNELLKKKAIADSTAKKYPPEKIYIQFDKPYYALNDTIWFKAWLMNGSTFFLHPKSGFLHLDIANDSNKVIKQYLLPVQDGVTWGNIALSPGDLKAGNYVIRAYTNWMRNFSDNNFFYKQIQVTGSGENNWLVNAKVNNDQTTVNAKMLFANMDRSPVSSQILQVKLMQGRKTIYQQMLHTDASGMMDVNLKMPQNTKGLYITADNTTKDHKAIIPLTVNSAGNIDLQFLPEGGNLVAGINTHIGFKAIGEDGRGVDVSGMIIDQDQKAAGTFKSLHNGMGSFDFVAKAGSIYKAKVSMPDGASGEYPLPVAKTSGTVLQVKSKSKDSIEVIIAANDMVQTGGTFFLTGKARGTIFFSANINLDKTGQAHMQVAKSLFPSGIAHFILQNTNGQPLNERLVYIDHHDDLHIDITPAQATYFPKDSVSLTLSVTDNMGKLVKGNFSLAVTDDALVKTDTLNDDNMLTRMLLTSDLKGFVERPGYYFQQNLLAEQALDNLMLTQGWVDYEPLKNDQAYKPETEFTVNGTVKNVFNLPVKNTHVLLFSKTPGIIMDTVTNEKGNFTFRQLPRVDTPVFVLKAVNKSGKSFNVGISVDEINPPAFTNALLPVMQPWYINSDSTLLNYTKTNAQLRLQENFPASRHMIREVKILGKKTVKSSQNLNGSGNADLVLDEKDMEAAGKRNWLQVLKENLRGFNQGVLDVSDNPFSEKARIDRILFSFVTEGKWDEIWGASTKDWYFIKGKPIKFIVDGTPVYQVYSPSGAAFNDITNYLKSHTAEDLKGIEVLSSTKYAMKYIPMAWGPIVSISDVAFVEITTRSGHGPAIGNTPGMYLYKPLAISWPKQFYKPRYTVTDTAKRLPDLRSTIHWEPNIVTDEYGKATMWFYAADKPATYTIITEGADFNGNLGYKRQKMIINSKSVATKSK